MSATNNANQSQVNLVAVFQAAHDIARELDVEKLFELSLSALLRLSKAQFGVVILANSQECTIAAVSTERSPDLEIAQAQCIPLACAEHSSLPMLMVRYTLDNCIETIWNQDNPDPHFADDPYWLAHSPLAGLCLPLCEAGELLGAIYLEDNDSNLILQAEYLQVLRSLCQQVAISLVRSRELSSITQRKEFEEALQPTFRS
jgi:adenylate cyclase